MPVPLEPAQWLAREPHLPPLVLVVYIACIAGASALANCSLLAALYKSPTTGMFSILLQLAIVDIALGVTVSPEIWFYNTSHWIFGNGSCIGYRGLNVFASTASSYLIVTFALHALATANLEEKILSRKYLRNDHDVDEEIRSSRHSLVAGSDSSTPPRTMNLDYKECKSSIPIKQPTIFVWILSLSLSVPDFALATTVQLKQNSVICTIVDTSQRLHLYSVLALFNLLLPIILMCVTLILVIIKLRFKRRILLDQCESVAALKLSVWLILIHLVLSVPRSASTAYNIYFSSMGVTNDTYFIGSNQNNNASMLGLAFSCSYLVSILVCPLFCIGMLPSVKRTLTNGNRNMDSDFK